MTNETALILRNDATLTAEPTADAIALRDALLSECALVGGVNSPTTNETANAALVAINTYLSRFEKARAGVKAPVLDFGRAIDGMAKEHVEPLCEERERITAALGDYHTLMDARRKAEEAKLIEGRNEIERKRTEALAEATTHAELDLINSRADEEAKALAPAIVVPQPQGQKTFWDWEYEVTNPVLLAMKHPDLVREYIFDTARVKGALDVLKHLPGVSATKKMVVKARAIADRKAKQVDV